MQPVQLIGAISRHLDEVGLTALASAGWREDAGHRLPERNARRFHTTNLETRLNGVEELRPQIAIATPRPVRTLELPPHLLVEARHLARQALALRRLRAGEKLLVIELVQTDHRLEAR